MADHPLIHLLRHLRHLAGAGQQTERTDRQLLQRFAACHDEDAFALLVRRHGAMVFGVCRRLFLLSNSHDAEDAFQATFVLLAQKAGSAHWQESVAGWLHEAARRVASNARRLAARRRGEERQAAAAGRARLRVGAAGRRPCLAVRLERPTYISFYLLRIVVPPVHNASNGQRNRCWHCGLVATKSTWSRVGKKEEKRWQQD